MKKFIISVLTACFAIGTVYAAKLCVGAPWIKEIKISGTQSVNVGSYQDWTANVDSDYANSNKAITWSVYSGESYASISSPTNTSARINGIGVGTATIRATANDGSGIYDDRTITVNQIYVSSFGVSCSPNPINTGAYSSCWVSSVNPSNATNQNYTWSSNAPGGSFYGSSAGNHTITAYAADGGGGSGSATVTVNPPYHPNLTSVCSPSVIANGGGIYVRGGCFATGGTPGVKGNPSESNWGYNCWCRVCVSGDATCGNWIYNTDYGRDGQLCNQLCYNNGCASYMTCTPASCQTFRATLCAP